MSNEKPPQEQEPPQAPAAAYGRGGRGSGGGVLTGAIALFAVAVAAGFIEADIVVDHAKVRGHKY